MKKIKILILLILIISCNNDRIDANFHNIKDGVAIFNIVNRSANDIEKFIFEIKYLDKSNKVLLLDTISYEESKELSDKPIFLKANDRTFIVQKIPKNCESAEIKILKIFYLENE